MGYTFSTSSLCLVIRSTVRWKARSTSSLTCANVMAERNTNKKVYAHNPRRTSHAVFYIRLVRILCVKIPISRLRARGLDPTTK